MSQRATTIIVTALVSSIIFLFVLIAGLDFIFLFLSTLPMLAVGLSKDPRMIIRSGALATLPIAFITGSPAAVLIFFFGFSLPCGLLCYVALRYYDIKLNTANPNNLANTSATLRLWYPMGLVTVHLAVYGCAMLAIITGIFATQEINLPQLLSQIITDEVTKLREDFDINFDVSVNNVSFMICGLMVWLWEILLLAHAWVINRSLGKRKLAQRPSLIITPFPMPNWLLTLICICALASLIGGESMRFLGKSCLIILLLPYFFQGSAILNIVTMKWPNRRFLLFFMYFTIIILFWPALIIAGIGVWDHIKILNKHLSEGGSSSRS